MSAAWTGMNGNLSRFATIRPHMSDSEPVDYYEALQISPNADADTGQRVFRLLAQRFHPDNAETGDATRFRALHDAYSVLSEPEQRAKYISATRRCGRNAGGSRRPGRRARTSRSNSRSDRRSSRSSTRGVAPSPTRRRFRRTSCRSSPVSRASTSSSRSGTWSRGSSSRGRPSAPALAKG